MAQMLTCMDDLAAGNAAASGDAAAAGDAGPGSAAAGPSSSRGHVVVIGATNRPDALDPALRWDPWHATARGERHAVDVQLLLNKC